MRKYLVVAQIGPLEGTKSHVLSKVKGSLPASLGRVTIREAICVTSRNPSKVGSAFERRFCRDLSLWYSHGERSDVFYKTSGSGSRATRRRVSLHQGDVCALREEGFSLIDKVIIELKSYGTLPIFSFLSFSSGKIGRWWIKLKKSSAKYGKTPWLVLHMRGEKVFLNLFPEYVRVPDEVVKVKTVGIKGVFSSDLFNCEPERFERWLKGE